MVRCTGHVEKKNVCGNPFGMPKEIVSIEVGERLD
jgi:hypothetical protein